MHTKPHSRPHLDSPTKTSRSCSPQKSSALSVPLLLAISIVPAAAIFSAAYLLAHDASIWKTIPFFLLTLLTLPRFR